MTLHHGAVSPVAAVGKATRHPGGDAAPERHYAVHVKEVDGEHRALRVQDYTSGHRRNEDR